MVTINKLLKNIAYGSYVMPVRGETLASIITTCSQLYHCQSNKTDTPGKGPPWHLAVSNFLAVWYDDATTTRRLLVTRRTYWCALNMLFWRFLCLISLRHVLYEISHRKESWLRQMLHKKQKPLVLHTYVESKCNCCISIPPSFVEICTEGGSD